MPRCTTFLAVALLQAVRGEIQCEKPAETHALVQSRKKVTANATQPFATVPVKWVIITKKDGTGRLSEAMIQSRMASLNKYYSGGDPDDITEDVVNKLNPKNDADSCNLKCDIKLCSGSPLADKVAIGATCQAICDNNIRCNEWTEYGRLYGPRANMNIEFKTEDIKYIVNDVWHEQCCCAHAAGLDYQEKQVEIIDNVVDKTKVRSSVTAIVCHMKSTAGMSNIFGKAGGSSCPGGPWVMLDKSLSAFTLAHEFGHFVGLHHTFNDYCPSGDQWGTCPAGTDMCDEAKNLGDRISDTPIHKKNGFCTVGADTCPNAVGKDPLDNMMSYSGCKLRRFTPEQVKRAHETLTDYFPAFLTSSSGGQPKDFPCDPEFPNGYKDGYKVAPRPAPRPSPRPAPKDPEPAPPAPPTTCSTDALCTSSSACCSGYGCGASSADGIKGCAPCDWKAFSYFFTSDSCKAASAKPKPAPKPAPEPAKEAPVPRPAKKAPTPPPAKKACSTDALCTTGSVCCSGYGCGAEKADEKTRGCAPCGWKQYGYYFTQDSCEPDTVAASKGA